MGEQIKVAGYQFDSKLGDVPANLDKIIRGTRITQMNGAFLTVFPECALTGYCFESKEMAMGCAESIPGPSTDKISALANDLNTHVIMGMLELDGTRLFNSCVLIGPSGVVGKHRKLHRPCLGVDRFVDPGDKEFQVYQIGELRVGMLICYDGSFAESVRCLSLLGADLIALSTNWPKGAEGPATFMSQTRAWENHVYFMPVNRVGAEGGFQFIGRSKICDPTGKILTELTEDEEGVFYADIDPAFAREKQIVRRPGTFEVNYIKDRRPDQYGKLLESSI